MRIKKTISMAIRFVVNQRINPRNPKKES